jgi:agmatine deiminase
MEQFLQNYTGASKIIWLKGGIAGDDTDGHIDNLVRFVRAGTVVCAYEEDSRDENHAGLKANYNVLRRSRDHNGRLLDVIKLPMPEARYDVIRGEKRRLPGSYVNFYIGNTVVLVPAFGCSTDAIALRIIQSQFPDRKAIAVDCSDLIYGSGTLHCISQQQPVAAFT